MNVVKVAKGRNVKFATIAPAGFRILGALDTLCRLRNIDIEITSGTDGTHSGPTDPHYKGEAFDIRSNSMPNTVYRQDIVREIINLLRDHAEDVPFEVSGGWAVKYFFAFLENEGTPNAHIHIQRRKNVVYG